MEKRTESVNTKTHVVIPRRQSNTGVLLSLLLIAGAGYGGYFFGKTEEERNTQLVVQGVKLDMQGQINQIQADSDARLKESARALEKMSDLKRENEQLSQQLEQNRKDVSELRRLAAMGRALIPAAANALAANPAPANSAVTDTIAPVQDTPPGEATPASPAPEDEPQTPVSNEFRVIQGRSTKGALSSGVVIGNADLNATRQSGGQPSIVIKGFGQ